MKKKWILGGLALVLIAVTGAVIHKERLLANGTTIFLELAPADPRSLIQGDYMRLDYEVARAASTFDLPRSGKLVVLVDRTGVAFMNRVYREGSRLGPGEYLLEYKVRKGRVQVASDAFFFQEGQADKFATARYGELRVSDAGASVLVGLRDGELRPLPRP